MNAKNIIGFSAALMIAASCITSCSKITDDTADKAEGKEIIVPLKFGGEIANLGNTPLSRASGNDMLYIQAYHLDEYDNMTCYAHGLFDDMTGDINIALKEGSKYGFIATLVKDCKDRIYKDEDGRFREPFNAPLTNKFIFDYFDEYSIKRGTAYLQNVEEGYDTYRQYPDLDRYYGISPIYTATSENTSPVAINLMRCVFGLKVTTVDFTDGRLVIQFNGEKVMEITAPQAEAEKIFSLRWLDDAYNSDAQGGTVADYTNNYGEYIRVRITRFNSANDEIPVGEQEVFVTRNMMTTLKVTIKSDMYENGMSITTENTEMIDSGEEVEFVGGGDF